MVTCNRHFVDIFWKKNIELPSKKSCGIKFSEGLNGNHVIIAHFYISFTFLLHLLSIKVRHDKRTCTPKCYAYEHRWPKHWWFSTSWILVGSSVSKEISYISSRIESSTPEFDARCSLSDPPETYCRVSFLSMPVASSVRNYELLQSIR